MALDEPTITTNVFNAVKTKFESEFPSLPPGVTTEQIAIKMANVIAEVVAPIITAIINDAEVTVIDVAAGEDTAPGTIS